MKKKTTRQIEEMGRKLAECFQLGFIEGHDDGFGTYDNDPTSARSVAYDNGRSLRELLVVK